MTAPPCQFPLCPELSATDHGMCQLHKNVHVSAHGSWVDDDSLEGGHG